jgi:hypothetical protein
MLIGWEEYNYFINCTAVQLMIFPKQTMWNEIALEELDENTNKSTKFFFNKRNENTNKNTKFWLKVLQDWALAREYDVDIEKYPILSC